MAIEPKRGCGYRKVGGLYLVGEGLPKVCDRLPFELKVCPVCNQGIKFSRGFTWLNGQFFGGVHHPCGCYPCPICQPDIETKNAYALMWVGEKYYTPESFTQEAMQLGVSKRIAQIPKNLKLGETWILLAHKKAIYKATDDAGQMIKEYAGIFYAFRPKRIEKLILEKDATPRRLAKLKKRNITPVIIPNDDLDHQSKKRRSRCLSKQLVK